MTQQTANALRESIHRIDRARKRVTWIMCVLLLLFLAYWVGTLLAKDDHTRMVAALAAVIISVFAAALAAMRISNRNTLEILKAIELLAGQSQKD